MSYKPFCSTEIVFLNKEELIRELLSLSAPNIVLIMSNSSALRWNLIPVIDKLQDKCKTINGSLTWINDVNYYPTQKDILQSLQRIGSKDVDLIIAFGGGSSIDIAKAISAFNDKKNRNYSVEEITECIKKKSYKYSRFIDIIAIPSTAGTGSEVTQWATIWDESKTSKFSIDDPMLKPKKALIVPELTLTMPQTMTLSSGLDALSHAIESYWSKHTTPLVQGLARGAIEIFIHYLRKAIEDPDDLGVREKLSMASVLAGLAFSQTRTTACHSISYPLTMLYGVPHGIAVSLTLDAVAQINKGHFPNDEELYGLFRKFNGIRDWIDMVCEGVIDMRLKSFGITEGDIPLIVGNAFTGGRIDNNPVELDENKITEILESVK